MKLKDKNLVQQETLKAVGVAILLLLVGFNIYVYATQGRSWSSSQEQTIFTRATVVSNESEADAWLEKFNPNYWRPTTYFSTYKHYPYKVGSSDRWLVQILITGVHYTPENNYFSLFAWLLPLNVPVVLLLAYGFKLRSEVMNDGR